jgi:uncharacterized repeat protein (TIGR01451 family)
LTQTHHPDPALAGQRLTCTLTVANTGPADTSGVVIADTLDPNVTFISASNGGLHNSGIVTWNVGIIPMRQSITRTLLVTVGHVASGTFLSNIVNVTSNAGTNSGIITTTVTGVDLSQQIYLPTVLK